MFSVVAGVVGSKSEGTVGVVESVVKSTALKAGNVVGSKESALAGILSAVVFSVAVTVAVAEVVPPKLVSRPSAPSPLSPLYWSQIAWILAAFAEAFSRVSATARANASKFINRAFIVLVCDLLSVNTKWLVTA